MRLGAAAGGDYDVIASVDGRLLYVETKSSPPKNIEEPEIAAFLKRAAVLSPDMAVFFEDTRLRMEDKIMPFFEGLLKDGNPRVQRLSGGVCRVGDKICVMNSKPDVVNNIGICIMTMLFREFM